VVLVFADNGIGFDAEKYKDRVCGLYQRFHDHIEGQGIGLFIIRSQIAALGGMLHIESQVDKGTTFTIVFKDQPAKVAKEHSSIQLENKRVVIQESLSI
jgi:signal transduction histidine kinase